MFKIVLSNLVDNSVMTDFLSKAEGVHNDLIANDVSISLLTDSILNLRSQLSDTSTSAKTIHLSQKKQIEEDIKNLEIRFKLLKSWFDSQSLRKDTA